VGEVAGERAAKCADRFSARNVPFRYGGARVAGFVSVEFQDAMRGSVPIGRANTPRKGAFMERLKRRRAVVAAATTLAAAVVAVSASPAVAGEVNGKGEPTAGPAHANSICVFSGRNDGEPPPGRTAAHVQNWGQIPKADRDFLTSIGSNPGLACNGHLNPLK
jgi:hypothetical protein